MTEEKVQVLQNVPLLASLGEELMKSLADGAEMVAFKKGDIVVREDDPGDALFAVISGRLQAYTRLKSGRERVFATYSNGDYFGEMPLLSGETHWCHVRVLNDSVLLKIPRDLFDAVVRRDPRVATSVFQRLGARIKQLRLEKHRAKWTTIIALYSALPGAGKTTFAQNLVASLAKETGEPVLLLDFSDRERSVELARCDRLAGLDELVVHTPLGYDRLNLRFVGDEKEIRLIAPLFGGLVKKYDYVLAELPNEMSASVFACLLQSDLIFVVARNEAAHLDRTRVLLRELADHPQSVTPKARVILTSVHQTGVPYVDEAEDRLGDRVSCLLRWIP